MKVYMYRLTSDTGFAPCFSEDDNLLTLACCKGGRVLHSGEMCKTGIRYWIGSTNEYKEEDIYVIGIYKGNLLYWAKVTKVLTMIEYYSNPKYFKRLDNIYEVYNGKLKRNNKNLNIHSDIKQQKRDIAGEYVLMSDNFVYLGNKTEKLDDFIDQYIPKRQETKIYSGDIAKEIINECKKVARSSNYKPNNRKNKNIQNFDNLMDCRKRQY